MKRVVRTALVLVAMFVTLGAFARIAAADDFFSSSPGALSAGHGALDNQDHCTDCHVGNTKDLSNDKCLNCHDHNNLRDRIAAGITTAEIAPIEMSSTITPNPLVNSAANSISSTGTPWKPAASGASASGRVKTKQPAT